MKHFPPPDSLSTVSEELTILTFLRSESGGHGTVILSQFSQEPWGNGEKITSSQRLDLSGVPEGRAHHHGAVIKLLIVVIDLRYADHTCTSRKDVLYTTVIFPRTHCTFYPFRATVKGLDDIIVVINTRSLDGLHSCTRSHETGLLHIPGSSCGS